MTQTGKLHIDFNSDSFKLAAMPSWRELSTRKPVLFDVHFPLPYAAIPTVLLGITGISAYKDQATSFEIDPVAITLTGFKVQLQSSLNEINAITITWLATDA